MLTVQMLSRNNEGTIRRALESLPGGVRVVVGDIGSTDRTRDICERFGAELVDVEFRGDYSEARNSLVSEGLNMYVEPWEFVVSGRDEIESVKGPSSVYVVEGGVVTKQVRIWEGGKFENPVFETIVCNAECRPDIVLGSCGGPDTRAEKLNICEDWMRRRPTSPEPCYYAAFSKLSLGDVAGFLSLAEKYLAMAEDMDTPSIMVRYNIAKVQFASGKMGEAARNAIHCLACKPCFSEFWCLLGDMFYKKADYDRAEVMYENAIIIGKRRPKDDDAPIEVKKYFDHPSRMIESIREIKSGRFFLGQKA